MDAKDGEDMYEDATEDVSLGQLVGLMDMFVGESDDQGEETWWGVFKSGLANSGSERKGERGGN